MLELDGQPEPAPSGDAALPVPSNSEARKTALADLRALEPRISQMRAEIAALPVGGDAT